MLRILEQTDLAPYADMLAALGAPSGVHVSEARENDGVKGFIAYAYAPDAVHIYAVDDGHDLNHLDGLVRSVLFKAELKGIEKAVFHVNNPEMMGRIRILRFVKDDENEIESIANIMENCKKCKENPANT